VKGAPLIRWQLILSDVNVHSAADTAGCYPLVIVAGNLSHTSVVLLGLSSAVRQGLGRPPVRPLIFSCCQSRATLDCEFNVSTISNVAFNLEFWSLYVTADISNALER
jgi:hypothetical protein